MVSGQRLPEHLGVDQDGKEWTMSELSGRKVVLYVYPRDSTPGCTSEACNLRDNYERLQAEGYAVIGVSTQDAKSHKRFIEALGVYGEKKMYGKTVMGVFRTTFLADEDGVVTRVIGPKEIKVKAHAEQILG